MTVIEMAVVESPVGQLHVFARDGALVGGTRAERGTPTIRRGGFGGGFGGHALVALDFADRAAEARDRLAARFGEVRFVDARDPAGAVSALRCYLRGELSALAELRIDAGGTKFQARVWAELRCIPAGKTWSYGDVARKIGAPGAMRAVGTANGRNNIALVIPCHRVVASGGGLGGYAGGLDRKRWLLRHEGAE